MKYIISILAICLLCSCSAVKPYERQYINDPEMQTASHTGSAFKNYVFSIRGRSYARYQPKVERRMRLQLK